MRIWIGIENRVESCVFCFVGIKFYEFGYVLVIELVKVFGDKDVFIWKGEWVE